MKKDQEKVFAVHLGFLILISGLSALTIVIAKVVETLGSL